MGHPKNPLSPDQPADGAESPDQPADGAETADDAPYPWLRDRYEVRAEGMPGGPGPVSGRGGSPPPLPRRTGDSGFRPYRAQAAGQDFWPLADPGDSWPLVSRPQAGPPGSRPAPTAPEPQESWAQNGSGEPWTPAEAPHAWSPAPPPDSGSRDYWDDADLQEPWPSGSPEAGQPQEPWPSGSPEAGQPQEPWPSGSPEAGPPQPGPPQPDPPQPGPPEAGPEEPRLQVPGPAPDAPGMPGTHDVPGWQEPPSPARHPGPPDLDEPWLRTAKPKSPRWRRGRGGHSAPEPAYQDDLPPADGTHLFPAQAGPASQDAGPAPSMESQDLWESWEPPYNQAGAATEPVLNRTAPYPELVRDAEYEDELWQPPGLADAGRDGPRYPGQHRRSAPARNAGRPRMSGAFLALAGALAVAGAIPLGILGVRALHHGNAALKTAPLSARSAAGAGPNGAGTFTALAGPGCPAAANAAAIPYHAPDGDGWHNGTASGSGPCGIAFTYSYLAMVPGNPGEWHDHYTWIFRTGMNNPSCSFSLYIPVAAQANSTDYYWFSAGDSNPDHRIADFTIDQATHQGQWVTKGPFTFPGGTVLIEATDRGEGSPAAAVAAGPARLSC